MKFVNLESRATPTDFSRMECQRMGQNLIRCFLFVDGRYFGGTRSFCCCWCLFFPACLFSPHDFVIRVEGERRNRQPSSYVIHMVLIVYVCYMLGFVRPRLGFQLNNLST